MRDVNGRGHEPDGRPGGGQFSRELRSEPDVSLTPTPWISDLQVEVADIFFGLPESADFVLSGGAALIAHRVVGRVSLDLDLFTYRNGGSVPHAADALQAALEARGWSVSRVHDLPEFVRLALVAPDGRELAFDLGVDSPPLDPSTTTFLGPTISVEENAGRKVLALFGRAEPRDFVDTYALSKLYSRERLLELAAQRDAGFDRAMFADSLGRLARIEDDDLLAHQVAVDAIPGLRNFFGAWATELRSDPS